MHLLLNLTLQFQFLQLRTQSGARFLFFRNSFFRSVVLLGVLQEIVLYFRPPSLISFTQLHHFGLDLIIASERLNVLSEITYGNILLRDVNHFLCFNFVRLKHDREFKLFRVLSTLLQDCCIFVEILNCALQLFLFL